MTRVNKKYNLPSQFSEAVGYTFSGLTSEKHKKNIGQFFTPKLIADFMGDLAEPKTDRISILDPGCGTAILSCSLIERLVFKTEINSIELTLYETDRNIIKETNKVLNFLTEWLQTKNIRLTVEINQKDFVLDNASAFTPNSLFNNQKVKKFDYIISNPPYFKIPKTDIRAVAAKELVYGQPNIYSLFMGLSAKLLKQNGEMIFITPRSFAAGNYFKAFRHLFFSEVSISDLHIFESRKKMFKNDNVLQENIIVRATKKNNTRIKITVSECAERLNKSKISIFRRDELVDLKSKDKILFIPSNKKEAATINIFRKWKYTLNDYNIQISTGPVVAFRCKDFLREKGEINNLLSPLVWLHNIREMHFNFPLTKKGKQSYIINSDESRKLLLRNKNYVLIRRFSSKDDKSRLVCCPYFSSNFNTDLIGLENHINYIHRPNGDLSDDEIWGIAALFSSSLFDNYFRTFNGNTQVGASELRQIKMPPLEKIIIIGNKVKVITQPQKQDIDRVINEVLFESEYVQNKRSTSYFERIGVA
jgi:adenine-specific DNA-methyltransferase